VKIGASFTSAIVTDKFLEDESLVSLTVIVNTNNDDVTAS